MESWTVSSSTGGQLESAYDIEKNLVKLKTRFRCQLEHCEQLYNNTNGRPITESYLLNLPYH